MNDAPPDLVIVGSGPAGMGAACQARNLGLSVVMLDEQKTIGGQIYRNVETAARDRMEVLGKDYASGRDLLTAFRNSGSRYLGGASVWNLALDGTVDYVVNGRVDKVAGKHVLIATGSMERPFPITGWTLPGVMGAGAAQILMKGAGALPAGAVVLAGCGPLLYLLAWQFLRAGVEIQALVDTTATSAYLRAVRHGAGALLGWRDLTKGIGLLSAIRREKVPVYFGCSSLSVSGTLRVEGLSFKCRGKMVQIPASLVLLHQGVVPNTQLSMSTGEAHKWDRDQLCWRPVTDAWGRLGETPIYVAGDSRGIVGAKASAVQGRLAALSVGERLGAVTDLAQEAAPLQRELRRNTNIRPFLDSLYRPVEGNRIPQADDVVVCRCEEVTAGQIRRHVELGCLGPNQTKAFGRCGMGPCQGRLCGLTVTEVIAEARGVDPLEVGHYRIRPPIRPIMLGDFLQQPNEFPTEVKPFNQEKSQ